MAIPSARSAAVRPVRLSGAWRVRHESRKPGCMMASMQTVPSRVGYTELANMPEDGRRYEIHGGELVVVPSPLPRHQLAVLAIVRILDGYAATPGGIVLAAPLDVVFGEFDVLQPDVLFFRTERCHLVQPAVVTRHAPDIVVEVLSPSTAAMDRADVRTIRRTRVLDRRPDRPKGRGPHARSRRLPAGAGRGG